MGSTDSLEPKADQSEAFPPLCSPEVWKPGHYRETFRRALGFSSFPKNAGSNRLKPDGLLYPLGGPHPDQPQSPLTPDPEQRQLRKVGGLNRQPGAIPASLAPALRSCCGRGWPSAFGGPFPARGGEQSRESSDLCCDKHPFFNWCW